MSDEERARRLVKAVNSLGVASIELDILGEVELRDAVDAVLQRAVEIALEAAGVQTTEGRDEQA